MDGLLSSSENKIPRLPKEREQFPAWKKKVWLYCKIRGLHEVLETSVNDLINKMTNTTSTVSSSMSKSTSSTGSHGSSNTSSSSNSSSNNNNNNTNTVTVNINELQQKADRAHYILYQSIHYSQTQIFDSIADGDAHGLWTKINEVYGVVKTSESKEYH